MRLGNFWNKTHFWYLTIVEVVCNMSKRNIKQREVNHGNCYTDILGPLNQMCGSISVAPSNAWYRDHHTAKFYQTSLKSMNSLYHKTIGVI